MQILLHQGLGVGFGLHLPGPHVTHTPDGTTTFESNAPSGSLGLWKDLDESFVGLFSCHGSTTSHLYSTCKRVLLLYLYGM